MQWRNIQNAFLKGRVPAHLKLYENEIKQLVEEDRVREKKRGHPTHTAVQTQQRVLRRGPARGKRARRDDSESEDIHASEASDSEEEEDEEDEEDEEEDEESAALSAVAAAAELEAASKRIVLEEELEEIRQKLAVYRTSTAPPPLRCASPCCTRMHTRACVRAHIRTWRRVLT
ncbi:hypothetical protein EON67_07420, partial [archaeon]